MSFQPNENGLTEQLLPQLFEGSTCATPHATMRYRMGVVSSKLLDAISMAIHWMTAVSLVPDSQVASDAG